MKRQFLEGDLVDVYSENRQAKIIDNAPSGYWGNRYYIKYTDNGEKDTVFETELGIDGTDQFIRINLGNDATARVSKDCPHEVIEALKAVVKHIEENPDSINFSS